MRGSSHSKGAKVKHPEEDYFRLSLEFNEYVNSGKGFLLNEKLDLINKEKKYLLECEIEESNKY
jgi:hypothetical protein